MAMRELDTRFGSPLLAPRHESRRTSAITIEPDDVDEIKHLGETSSSRRACFSLSLRLGYALEYR
jgi:hypothetical protein